MATCAWLSPFLKAGPSYRRSNYRHEVRPSTSLKRVIFAATWELLAGNELPRTLLPRVWVNYAALDAPLRGGEKPSLLLICLVQRARNTPADQSSGSQSCARSESDPPDREASARASTGRACPFPSRKPALRALVPVHPAGAPRLVARPATPLLYAIFQAFTRRTRGVAQLRPAPAAARSECADLCRHAASYGPTRPSRLHRVHHVRTLPAAGLSDGGLHPPDRAPYRRLPGANDRRGDGYPNSASIALAEALGFEWVGTTIGADHFKGSVSDEHRYELSVRE